MLKSVWFFFVLTFVGVAYCQNTKSASNVIKTNSVDLTDTVYFETVRNYISKNGTSQKVNISSDASKEYLIEYRVLKLGKWKMTIDHTNRIYMTVNNLKYGNILKENSTIQPEVIYGVPDKNPQRTVEKKVQLIEKYKQLIELALSAKH